MAECSWFACMRPTLLESIKAHAGLLFGLLAVMWGVEILDFLLPFMNPDRFGIRPRTVGGLLGIFLTGSFLIERVFNIPGVGLLAFEAIQTRDFPVVLGFLVISSVLLLLGNLLSDLVVAFVDPRVRFE